MKLSQLVRWVIRVPIMILFLPGVIIISLLELIEWAIIDESNSYFDYTKSWLKAWRF